MSKNYSRRKFFQCMGGTAISLKAGPLLYSGPVESSILSKPVSANDKINIALIGAGIMGTEDADTALKIPGVHLAAACDLYTGRLVRAKEKYGANLFTTTDYREVLERKDIDAVIVATSDHWHARIATEALQKGKHVYCEKPVVKTVEEGLNLISAQKQTQKVLQVGSQVIAGYAYHKAKELLQSGDIGKLNCIEAIYDRHSSLGAWQYTLPTDISPQTVKWEKFTEGMPHQDFDAKKLFRWRCYREFGTGVAGDLFVHLLTGIHMITGSKGPTKIQSAGQLCFWKDGRDVPDVMTAIMEYPETNEHPKFLLTLRVNFVSGAGEKTLIRFIGDSGVMTLGSKEVNVQYDLLPKAPGIGQWDAITTYPSAMQQSIMENYNRNFSKEDQKAMEKKPVTYSAPAGEDKHLNHFTDFFNAVRKGSPVFEDATFGFRAAAPCLLCNESYYENKIMHWDPIHMKKI